MALEWYGKKLKNEKVTFLCDNDSVVQGAVHGSKDPEMNKQLIRIWAIAQKRKIDMKIEWVSTKLRKADAPSRIIDTREQKLTEAGFKYLQSFLNQQLEIDIAATVQKQENKKRNPLSFQEINKKCEQFIARRPSENALGADFLSFPIHKLLGKALYAFPPKKIGMEYFKKLQTIAAPWVLIVTSYEAENPILVMAREKGYRIISLPNNCILTPCKKQTELGFWKIADNISTIHAVANRL